MRSQLLDRLYILTADTLKLSTISTVVPKHTPTTTGTVSTLGSTANLGRVKAEC